MEVKVNCACGTRFKFDVEPHLGRMPQRVACPACNTDATDAANAFIAAQTPTAPVTFTMISPPAAAPLAPPPPPPVAAPGRRQTRWFLRTRRGRCWTAVFFS
ncbi:MAG: hypothetical protein EXS35_02665 [Pedosphaera sp.]|nr:hypothetical protein [Pedosphaera sp.]